ncbi:hydrogenase nickel incorporation protein HypB [Candidatus Aminicenantes bacterium AC-335-A11]|nr:hydrogenase nickel incorporation protein HypB [SCandidatus Aminicenantes bacterium Aminicenantia_JdfR_composite]MCP2596613.1 hydrogenase nickel incorporation protein HypB [Candidatus Aminicenantes bacterium AC-335-G13]MCP2598061.1 hydrogenase nickel incorporation protein HypB [Candidatus Aminicenantes bacterium AC-335-L06]MCP2605895.1 hydrogenase nickel incorporation protein HypB [Candidatus Aminicenantes bacterium AC-335-O07]MCP2618355.1 hydrogenase nickel incorporation protein HypB [Candid
MKKKREYTVLVELLGSNQRVANEIRRRLTENGTLVINFMSSPGAGKTSLLEIIGENLKKNYRLAVIEGDIETEKDAERIRAKGIPAIQITTGGACHLEAKMLGKIFDKIPKDLDFLFIENIGNLVCPANYDLGEHIRCVLLSAPEGDDKPKKYPKAFITSQCLIITKSDLFPYLPFDPERAKKEALSINPKMEVFITSAINGEGIDDLIEYFKTSLHEVRSKE